MLDDLCAAELRSRMRFEQDPARRERLMGAVDAINGLFGKFSAVPVTQGFEREWKGRAESKPPAWTTRVGDVPSVRASCLAFIACPAITGCHVGIVGSQRKIADARTSLADIASIDCGFDASAASAEVPIEARS